MRSFFLLTVLVFSLNSLNSFAQKKATTSQKGMSTDTLNSALFNGIRLRSLGPAITSGRISDLAINPRNNYEYYVAVASGGVWKTTNAGVTFTPLFDGEGSYSIGCISIDPKNTNTVFVCNCKQQM